MEIRLWQEFCFSSLGQEASALEKTYDRFGAIMNEKQGFIDPVCGMSVARGAFAEQKYGNQVWSFYRHHCLDKFESGPDSYVTSCGHIKTGNEEHHHGHGGGHENHVAESGKENGRSPSQSRRSKFRNIRGIVPMLT